MCCVSFLLILRDTLLSTSGWSCHEKECKCREQFKLLLDVTLDLLDDHWVWTGKQVQCEHFRKCVCPEGTRVLWLWPRKLSGVNLTPSFGNPSSSNVVLLADSIRNKQVFVYVHLVQCMFPKEILSLRS